MDQDTHSGYGSGGCYSPGGSLVPRRIPPKNSYFDESPIKDFRQRSVRKKINNFCHDSKFSRKLHLKFNFKTHSSDSYQRPPPKSEKEIKPELNKWLDEQVKSIVDYESSFTPEENLSNVSRAPSGVSSSSRNTVKKGYGRGIPHRKQNSEISIGLPPKTEKIEEPKKYLPPVSRGRGRRVVR